MRKNETLQTLELKHTRERQIAEAAAPFTGGRKSGEFAALMIVLNGAHRSLTLYDKQDNPPPLAGSIATTFDAAIARLAELAKTAE